MAAALEIEKKVILPKTFTMTIISLPESEP